MDSQGFIQRMNFCVVENRNSVQARIKNDHGTTNCCSADHFGAEDVKVCIYGAGAIGGLMGAKLARGGQEVTLIARGPHLAALRANGLTLTDANESFTVKPQAFENPEAAGEQDYVIVALKANAVPAIAEHLRPLLGPKTAVVMAVNGVP